MTNAEMKTDIHCIEKDLKIAMIDDFDEIERIIKNDIDLSEKTKQWLEGILHKDMNRFFKDIMIRLGHPDYLGGGKDDE